MLHTWGQNLQHHPHVHCVVPGGGLALDGSRWVAASSRFLLPVRVLSRVFRGKFTAELKQLLLQRKLQFHGSLQELAATERFGRFLRRLFTKDWVVYAKTPFGGAEHVLHYLARYTHRVKTASEPAGFSYRKDPCCGRLATSHVFETSQSSGKDAVTAGIAHSSRIATHRIRHATGFLQTPLSKLPRQPAQLLPASCARQA